MPGSGYYVCLGRSELQADAPATLPTRSGAKSPLAHEAIYDTVLGILQKVRPGKLLDVNRVFAEGRHTSRLYEDWLVQG